MRSDIKPKVKMKRLVEILNQCLYGPGCAHDCPYDDRQLSGTCQRAMICDAYYYLSQALEKSEKGQNNVGKRKEVVSVGTCAEE